MKLDKEKLKRLTKVIFSQFPYRFDVVKVADLVFLPDENSKDLPCITYEDDVDLEDNFSVEYMSMDFLRLRPIITAREPLGYKDLIKYLQEYTDDDILETALIVKSAPKPFVEYTLYVDAEGEIGYTKGKLGD